MDKLTQEQVDMLKQTPSYALGYVKGRSELLISLLVKDGDNPSVHTIREIRGSLVEFIAIINRVKE